MKKILAVPALAALALAHAPPAHLPRPTTTAAVEVRAGERMQDLVGRLEKSGLVTRRDVERFAAEQEFPRFPALPPPRRDIARFEGMLRPGAYVLAVERGRTYGNARRIFTFLVGRGAARLAPGAGAGGLSPFQQAVLASLVEKEAAGRRQYAGVASVFRNRLKGGWRLCSCPCLEYALGFHRPFLTKQDLAADSPYNLYARKGLPPGPICFFSDEALRAVNAPPATGYFFFVFDWTSGKLLFAKTYREHLRNAETARRNYAARRGAASLHKKYPGLFYEDGNY